MSGRAGAGIAVDVETRPDDGRVPALDGLRGLAALYVLLGHCWLYTFTDAATRFPSNTSPDWLEWLMFGRLAVVFFLVLSGFSLAVGAARHGWRLGGLVRFLRRRAWRILPPYWAALVFSVLVSWAVVRASHFGPPGPKSVLVFGLLAQDVVWAPTPNGTFWSIAVEAELYLVFPLMLLLRRRLGPVVLLAAVTLPVIALGLLAEGQNPSEGRIGLTPHLAPLFTLGLVAAGVLVAPERVRRLPWPWLTALAGVPVLVLILLQGSAWTVNHYFWVDLALGPAMALLVAGVAVGRPAGLLRLLDSRPLRGLGRFSYSLYLVHLPIVMTVHRKLALRLTDDDLTQFWITLLLAVPLSLFCSWVFATIFELPFQRYRSWAALRVALRTRRSAEGGGEELDPSAGRDGELAAGLTRVDQDRVEVGRPADLDRPGRLS